MCGICGIAWQDKMLVKCMADTLIHRGPDAGGVHVSGGVSLGHRRLSIIDLSSRARQPMRDESGELWITYNGEIFNFRELREELEGRHIFKSESDTEVLLYAYKEWGPDCLERLNGQFAFCIHDQRKNLLFLARDRLGINPLYYRLAKQGLAFASELKGLLPLGFARKLDEEALMHYLAFGHTLPKQSILKGCRKLPPGHYLTYDLGKRKPVVKRYWRIVQRPKEQKADNLEREILELLDDAVRIRLVADVPVGAFLSGGVDSSAVVGFMRRHKQNIDTFSINFDHDEYDESEWSRRIAKKFRTHHHVVKFTAAQVKALLPTIVNHYDEPLGDSSMIPTFLISQVAKRHVTVSLSGDGGDELFGGYTAHQLNRILRYQLLLPRLMARIIFRLIPPFRGLEKLRAFFEIGALPEEERYARLMSNVPINTFKRLTGRNPRTAYRLYARPGAVGRLTTAINHDLHRYLPEDILVKVDRASLAHGLESRPPILDHRLVELAATIPSDLKLRGREGKHILKRALSTLLPSEILTRKKQGFSVPLRQYFAGELRNLICQKVLKEDGPAHLDKKELARLAERTDNASVTLLWRVLMLNLWWERWGATSNQSKSESK